MPALPLPPSRPRRFINLQRHVWVPEEKALCHLHPCISLSAEFLREFGFDTSDVAFTPEDTFQLWEALEKASGATTRATAPPRLLATRQRAHAPPRHHAAPTHHHATTPLATRRG